MLFTFCLRVEQKAISNQPSSQQLLIALLSYQASVYILLCLPVLLMNFAYLILSFPSFILCSILILNQDKCIFSCSCYSSTAVCLVSTSFFTMPFWYSALKRASDTVVIFSASYLLSALGHFVNVSLIKSFSVVPTLKQCTFIPWIIFLTKSSWQWVYFCWSPLIFSFLLSYHPFLSKVFFCDTLQMMFRLSSRFSLVWSSG